MKPTPAHIRTIQQNRSGHKWCELLAESLNDAGYTLNSEEVLRLPVPWSKEAVKEYLFKPVMRKMYPDKTSTAQLTRSEWSSVVEALNLALGERVGVYVGYPCEERDD